MEKPILWALAIAQWSFLWKDAIAFSVAHRPLATRVPDDAFATAPFSKVSSSLHSNYRSESRLFSLKPLVDEVAQSVVSPSAGRKTIFVGGKGG